METQHYTKKLKYGYEFSCNIITNQPELGITVSDIKVRRVYFSSKFKTGDRLAKILNKQIKKIPLKRGITLTYGKDALIHNPTFKGKVDGWVVDLGFTNSSTLSYANNPH